jgi:hypothetical protein
MAGIFIKTAQFAFHLICFLVCYYFVSEQIREHHRIQENWPRLKQIIFSLRPIAIIAVFIAGTWALFGQAIVNLFN